MAEGETETCDQDLLLQVLLAKRKCDGTFYAVKVLHKKTILKKKEVCLLFLATSANSGQCISYPGNAIEVSCGWHPCRQLTC